MRGVDGTAIVLCNGCYATVNGKTAHGLVRGTERYRILGGRGRADGGAGRGRGARRDPPRHSDLRLDRRGAGAPAEKPDYAIVGVATHGGRMTPRDPRVAAEALEKGLSIVNGLHEFASDDAELARLARSNGATITDVRKVKPRRDLHFWTGEILKLATPRIAVIGTDCALGKRTTTKLLVEACRRGGIAAEWISTGQTGWLQGAPFGIVLDALPNDFVTGELEHAILSCARELAPRSSSSRGSPRFATRRAPAARSSSSPAPRAASSSSTRRAASSSRGTRSRGAGSRRSRRRSSSFACSARARWPWP